MTDTTPSEAIEASARRMWEINGMDYSFDESKERNDKAYRWIIEMAQAALAAQDEPGGVVAWQPIETAPSEQKQAGCYTLIRNMNSAGFPMVAIACRFGMADGGHWCWISTETGKPISIESGAEFLPYTFLSQASQPADTTPQPDAQAAELNDLKNLLNSCTEEDGCVQMSRSTFDKLSKYAFANNAGGLWYRRWFKVNADLTALRRDDAELRASVIEECAAEAERHATGAKFNGRDYRHAKRISKAIRALGKQEQPNG